MCVEALICLGVPTFTCNWLPVAVLTPLLSVVARSLCHVLPGVHIRAGKPWVSWGQGWL